MNSHQHNLFHTPIWGYVLKSEKYHCENYLEFIQELMKTEPSAQKSNFGGWQSRDNLNKEPLFKEFVNLIESLANDSVKDFMNEKLKMTSLWANVNKTHDSNGAHVHEGELSGVFYIKTSPNCGKLILINPAVRAEASRINQPNFAITPQDYACIFFPSWLSHYVEPNRSEDDRISLSFNLELS